MKIAVVGCREYTKYKEFKVILFQKLFILSGRKENYLEGIELVSGGARGTDFMAEKFAKEHNIIIHVFRADWDNLGIVAGRRRNTRIANYADIGIAFWDEVSKGTKHTISEFKRLNKDMSVIRLNKLCTTSV